MEQNQMSRYTFSLNLENTSLPNAISALVEAWYDSQVIEVDGGKQTEARNLQLPEPSNGESKRGTWKQCAWYVRPKTYSKLKRYVNRLQEDGRNCDASDVVDSALQMWMDDFV
jgi:hypothetical protein